MIFIITEFAAFSKQIERMLMEMLQVVQERFSGINYLRKVTDLLIPEKVLHLVARIFILKMNRTRMFFRTLVQAQPAFLENIFSINCKYNIDNGLVQLFFIKEKSAPRAFGAVDHILLYQRL